MRWEAAAKLVAGPVDSTWKLTQHRMRATSVYESARGTSKFTSFRRATAVAVALWATRAFRSAKRLQELQEKTGEDRNRTYLATCVATTVLKTARATRHPSLSGKKKTSNVQLSEMSVEC